MEKSTVTDLQQWLKTQNTDSQITQMIVTMLDQHWYLEMIGPSNDNPILEAQNQIGLDWFINGCMSRKWRTTQDAYWTHFGSRKSSKQWMTEIVKNCWNMSWEMWEQCNDVLHNEEENRNNILEVDVNQAI